MNTLARPLDFPRGMWPPPDGVNQEDWINLVMANKFGGNDYVPLPPYGEGAWDDDILLIPEWPPPEDDDYDPLPPPPEDDDYHPHPNFLLPPEEDAIIQLPHWWISVPQHPIPPHLLVWPPPPHWA